MENVMKMKLVVPIGIAMTLGFVNSSASAFTPSSPIGEVVPLSGATRTIPIHANTKYVNVTAHETVKFEANGNAFAINFSGSPATTFAFVPSWIDLNQLAPAGVLNHEVTVYVAPDPLYIP
jgi:heavy-metal resistance protein CzcE